MRIARLVLFGVFVLGLVVLLAGAVARTFLTSPQAATHASAVLSKTYGAHIQVSAADVNLYGTALGGVRVFEVDAQPDDQPWAVAEQVQADVSLWELLSGGAMPQHVQLRQAHVVLRFDEAGHLLTSLPRRKSGERLPTIHITDAQLTIKQLGRPDLIAHGIDATFQPEEGELRLTGSGVDPRWGQWRLSGGLDPVHGISWLSLESAGSVALSADTLRGLPFVSPKVWQAISADGESPVQLTVRYEPNVGRILYRVQLDPEKTDLHVIPIDLTAQKASGHVIIENGVVTLKDVRGRTGDGDVQAEGVLNFRAAPTRFEFDVKVQHVDIQKLPKKWPLPKIIEGRLTGQANLVVTVIQGKTKTTGQGEGEVMGVPVGFGKKATIPLKLSADEHGFHFVPRWPRTGSIPITPAVDVTN